MRSLSALPILLVLVLFFFVCAPVSAEETLQQTTTTLLWEEYISPQMYAVEISGDGTVVAGAGEQGVKVIAEDGSALWMAEIPSAREIALSEDASRILAGGIDLQLFDQTGTLIWKNSTGYFVLSDAISPAGDQAYSAWDDSTVLRYNMTDMTRYDTGIDTDLVCMEVTDNGHYIVGGTLTGELMLWDMQGNVKWTRTCPGEKAVQDIALSSGGSLVAYTIDDQVYLINRAGRTLWNAPLSHASGVSMSADGSCIAVAGANGISLFDRKGTLINSMQNGHEMIGVSLSDDGTKCAACDQKNAFLYLLTTGASETGAVPQEAGETQNQQKFSEDNLSQQTVPTLPVASGDGIFSVLCIIGSVLATVLFCAKERQ